MKVVYVSLPLGTEPFSAVSLWLLAIMGVRDSDGSPDPTSATASCEVLAAGQPAWCWFIGLVLGMLVAVLPGLTLVMGVVLALPFAYSMELLPAIILLTAMYVSGTYGGAFTAILFRIPGEPIDVPLTVGRLRHGTQGPAGQGAGLDAVRGAGRRPDHDHRNGAGVCAGRHVRADVFPSPEYFAIIIFGLTSVVSLGRGSFTNAAISLTLGLMIGTVGIDPIYGAAASPSARRSSPTASSTWW